MRILAPILAVAVGCGGGFGSQDEIADARIDALKSLVTILEGIGSKDDVEAARPKVQEVMERLDKISAAAKGLGEPTAEDRRRMQEKVAAAQTAIEPRMGKIQERLQGDPDAMMAVSRMMMEAVMRMGR